MEIRNFLLLLVFAAAVQAGPLTNRNSGQCAVTCSKNDQQAPAYEVGKSYTFNYMTRISSQIKGASEESTGLRLTSKIVFSMVTPCEMAMQMVDIKVSEQDPTNADLWIDSPYQSDYEYELATADLHFVWNEGSIPEVCSASDELEWVLNVKKAAISMLQNTSPDKHKVYEGVETDISGKCRVKYSPQLQQSLMSSQLTVVKETDLLSCLDQQRVRSSFQSSSYRVPARMQSMPLTRANRSCKMLYFSGGSLQSASCNEEHLLRPFNSAGNGANVMVEQQMEFVQSGGTTKLSHVHKLRRSKLEYGHHEPAQAPSRSPVEDVRSDLRHLCNLGATITPETPIAFNKLLHRLRKLTPQQLMTIRTEVDALSVCRINNRMARQFFFDALPSVLTPASTEVMKDLILNNKVSNTEAQMWLTSLAFIQKPSKEMLESLLPLLEMDSPNQQAQLGIGALVNQFCKANDRCEREPVVVKIGQAFSKLIGDECQADQRKEVLIALKAIGNSGYLVKLMPKLVKCASKSTNLMEVRVAAIEALRRTPCSVDRTPLMQLISDKDVDSELRITAYLGLMTCPSVEMFATVKELLTAESSNQFASFVWTHLTNLLETSDPHKQDIRLIVEDVKLKSQYDMDKLKYSRNVEKSVFSNYLNAGAKFESNLIWSQKSFLPRSATLNMTLDLFGKSFNFLEVGGRAQGMEILLEKYLGPKGIKKRKEEDPNTQLAALDKTFKLVEDKIGGSLDIKIFGNQIAFIDLWREDLQRSGGNVMQMLQSLKQLREVNFQKSFSFLESEVTLPTISGFPLKLSVNGTASLVVQAKAKLDMKKLMQWPPKFEMEGRLAPSGAVHVSGMLAIDAFYSQYGVKMTTAGFTNTDSRAIVKASGTEELRVEIMEPRPSQNLLNLKSSFYIIHRSVERQQEMRKDLVISKKACTSGPFFEKVLGLEFCAKVKHPSLLPNEGAPPAPLAAGYEVDVAMFKRDAHTKYIFHLLNQQQGMKRRWKLLADTPGSRMDRKIHAELLLDPVNYQAKAVLETPWKKGNASFSIQPRDENSQLMTASAQLDGFTYFDFSAVGSREEDDESIQYRINDARLSLLGAEKMKVSVFSSVSKLPEQRNYRLTARFEPGSESSVQVDAVFKANQKNIDASLELKANDFSANFKSNHFMDPQWTGTTRAAFQFSGEAEKSISMKYKVAGISEDQLSATAGIAFSEYPQFDTSIIGTIGGRKSGINNNLQASVEFAQSKNKYSILHSYAREQLAASSHRHSWKVEISSPTSKHSLEKVFEHKLDWTLVKSSVKVNRNGDRYDASLDMNRTPGTFLYAVHGRGQFFDEAVAFMSKFSAVENEEAAYLFSNELHLLSKTYKVEASMKQPESQLLMQGSVAIPGCQGAEANLRIDLRPESPTFFISTKSAFGDQSLRVQSKLTEEKKSVEAVAESNGRTYKAKAAIEMQESGPTFEMVVFWNPDNYQMDRLIISARKAVNQRPHQLERMHFVEVDYKQRQYQLLLNEDYVPNKGNLNFGITAQKKQYFASKFSYEINDGWTEKGILATLSLETPIERYRSIAITLNGYGSLRVRKLSLQSLIDNRRSHIDLLINLGNINNFDARLGILTPWPSAGFIQFELFHYLSDSEIKSKLLADINTKKVAVQLHATDNSNSYKRDVGLTLKTNSSISLVPTIEVNMQHKDDGEQFRTSGGVLYKNKKAGLQSRIQIYPRDNQLETSGNITLSSSLAGYESVELVWSHLNNLHLIKSESKLTYQPGKAIQLQLDAYRDDLPNGDRKQNVEVQLKSSFMEDASLAITHKEGSQKRSLKAKSSIPLVGDYSVELLSNHANMKYHLQLTTPHQSLRRFGAVHSMEIEREKELSSNSEIFWNNEVTKLNTKYISAGREYTLESVLQTPFENARSGRLVMHFTDDKVTTEVTHEDTKICTVTVQKVTTSAGGTRVGVKLETPFKLMSTGEIALERTWTVSKKELKLIADYNDEYSTVALLSSTYSRNALNIIGDWKMQCPRGSRKALVRLTNTQLSVNTEVNVEGWTDKPITITNTIDKQRRTFDLKAATPFAAAETSKLHAALSEEAGLLKADLVFEHLFNNEMLKMELVGELNGLRQAKLEANINTPSNLIGDVTAKLRHSFAQNGEWKTVGDVSYDGGRIDVRGDMNIGTDEFTAKWNVRTPFLAFEELTLQLEHRSADLQIRNQHSVKLIAAGFEAQIDNKIDLQSWTDIKLSTEFNSNIRGIESMKLRLRHLVENSQVYDAVMEAEYRGRKFALELGSRKSDASFQVNALLKSPFDALKVMNGSVQLSFTNWMHWAAKTKAHLESSFGKFSYKTEAELYGQSAKFRISRPQSNLLGEWSLNKKDGIVETEASYTLNGDKKLMKVTAEQIAAGEAKLKIELTGQPTLTGVTKFSSTEGALSHELTVQSEETVMIQMASSAAVSRDNLGAISGLSFASKSNCFSYEQDTAVKMELEANKLMVDLSHKCNWYPLPASLKLTVQRDSSKPISLSAAVSVQAPYIREANASFSIEAEGLLKGQTEFAVSAVEIKPMSASFDWNLLTDTSALLRAEVTEGIKMNAKLAAVGDNIVISLDMPHTLSEKWVLTIGGQYRSVANAQLKLHLQTSIPSLRSISIDHSHNFEDEARSSTELQLPDWPQKGRIHILKGANTVSLVADSPTGNVLSGDVHLFNSNEHRNLKLSVRCDQLFGSDTLEIGTSLNKNSASVDAKVPLHLIGNENSVRISSNGYYFTRNGRVSLDLKFSQSKDEPLKQLLLAEYLLLDKQAGHQVLVIAPELSFKVEKLADQVVIKATYGKESVEFNQKVTANSARDFEIELSGKVAGSRNHDISFSMKHKCGDLDFKNDLELTCNGQKLLEYSVDVLKTYSGVTVAASLSAINDVSLNVRHQGDLTDFNNYFELKSKYHSPVMFKGQVNSSKGDFSASMPAIGDVRVQLKRVDSKSLVSLFLNNQREVAVELDSHWNGFNGATNVTVKAFGDDFAVSVANEGDSWRSFMTTMSLLTPKLVYKTELGHSSEEIVISATVRPVSKNANLHAFILRALKSDQEGFRMNFQLVREHSDVFKMEIKHEYLKVFSVLMKTNIYGMRHSEFIAKVASSAVILELNNDLCGVNSLRFDLINPNTGKLIFDSSHLGVYALQMSYSSAKFAESTEIQITIPNQDVTTLKLDLTKSETSRSVSVILQTPFTDMKENKAAFSLMRDANKMEVTATAEQDTLGKHEVSALIPMSVAALKGHVKASSSLKEIDNTAFTWEFTRATQEIAFVNNFIGKMSFEGKLEEGDENLEGTYTLMMPCKHISKSIFSFKILNSESRQRAQFDIKNPFLGESSVEISHQTSIVDNSNRRDAYILVVSDSLPGKIELKSQRSVAKSSEAVMETRLHSVEMAHFGKYSIAESFEMLQSQMHYKLISKAPIDGWRQNEVTFNLEKENGCSVNLQVLTEKFGKHMVHLLKKDNEMVARFDLFSIKNELTVAGWKPQTDSNGSQFLDFYATVHALTLKSNARLTLKQGQISVTAGAERSGVDLGEKLYYSEKYALSNSLTWSFLPGRVLLDAKADIQLPGLAQVWGATADINVADENECRFILKVAAPIRAIGASQLEVVFKTSPVIDGSFVAISPAFGHFKVKSFLQKGSGLLLAPVTAKFSIDTSLKVIPSYELILQHSQKEAKLFFDFNFKNLRTNQILFKSGAVADIHNNHLRVHAGRNDEFLLRWSSRSDLSALTLSERMSVSLNGEKFTAKVKLSQNDKKMLAMKITTPYTGFEKFGFKLVAAVPMPFHIEAKLILPHDEMDATAVVDFTEGVHLRAGLHLPYFPRGELALQAAGSLKNYKLEVTGEYDAARFSALSHWELSDTPALKLRLETPAKDLQIAEIDMKTVRKGDQQRMMAKLVFNDNQLKLHSGMNSKKVSLQLNTRDGSYSVEVKKLTDPNKRAINLLVQKNDLVLIDISARLTSAFADKSWTVRLPHSGLFEVKKFFDYVNGRSKIEWDFTVVGSSWRSLQELSFFTRVEHKELYISQHMAMMNDGHVSFKTSANLPKYGLNDEVISGQFSISSDSAEHTRMAVQVATSQHKMQLAATTNWKNSMHFHINGLEGVRYIEKDSLTVQFHALASDSVLELVVKAKGLAAGDLFHTISLKKLRDSTYELNAELHCQKHYMFAGTMFAQMRKGWFGDKDYTFSGKLLKAYIDEEVEERKARSITWSVSKDKSKAQFEMAVVDGPKSEVKVFDTTVAAAYTKGVQISAHATVSGVRHEAQLDMASTKVDLAVTSDKRPVLRITALCQRSGYLTYSYVQGLLVEMEGRSLLKLEAGQEYASRGGNIEGFAKLQVIDMKAAIGVKSDSQAKKYEMEVDITPFEAVAITADLSSWTKPTLRITYGSQEIIARMQHEQETDSFNTEMNIANPWIPLKLKVHHKHSSGNHQIRHEYTVGKSHYSVRSHFTLNDKSIDSALRYKSPRHNLVIIGQLTPMRLKHSVVLNGRNYVVAEVEMEHTASTHRSFAKQRIIKASFASDFLQPITARIGHHHNNDWRDSAWDNRISCGDSLNFAHSGQLHVANREFNSEINVMGHLNKAFISNGHYRLSHHYDNNKFGELSGAYSRESSSLTINNHKLAQPITVELKHNLAARDGVVAVTVTGSYWLPKAEAKWNLHYPNLKAEVTVSDFHLSLNHVEHSIYDLNFHHKLSWGSAHHDLIGEFVWNPSTSGSNAALEAGIDFRSSAAQPIALKLQYQPVNQKEHCLEASATFGQWKLLHNFRGHFGDMPWTLELTAYNNGARFMHHLTSLTNNAFKSETFYKEKSVYIANLQAMKESLRIGFSSDVFNFGSETKIQLQRDSSTYHLAVTHKGLLPNLEADCYWNSANNVDVLKIKLNKLKMECSVQKQEDAIVFNSQLELVEAQFTLSGTYDAAFTGRLPHLLFRLTSPRLDYDWVQWTHDIRNPAKGHFDLSFGQRSTLSTRCRWSFDSSASSMSFELADIKISLASASAEDAKFQRQFELALQNDAIKIIGAIKASNNWKMGNVRLSSDDVTPVTGSWNCEGAEKTLFLKVHSLLVNVTQKHSEDGFTFDYLLKSKDLSLNRIRFFGKVEPSDDYLRGKLKANLQLTEAGNLAVNGKWDFFGAQKRIEINAPQVRARLVHSHNSNTDFNFNHKVALGSKVHSVSGKFKLAPAADHRHQLIAKFSCKDIRIDLDHKLSGYLRQEWQHRMDLGQWRFRANGQYDMDAQVATSNISMHQDKKQLFHKQFSMTRSELKYQDEILGVKAHHFIASGSNVKKFMSFNSDFYEGVNHVSVTFDQGSQNAVEVKVGSTANAELLFVKLSLLPSEYSSREINAATEVRISGMKLQGMLNSTRSSMALKVGITSDVINGKLSSYVHFEGVNKFKVNATIKSIEDIGAVDLLKFNAENDCDLPNMKQELKLHVAGSDLVNYELKSDVTDKETPSLHFTLGAEITPRLNFKVSAWLDDVFAMRVFYRDTQLFEIVADKSYHLQFKSGCHLLSKLELKLKMEASKSDVVSIIEVFGEELGFNFEIDNGSDKALKLLIATPFDAARKISSSFTLQNLDTSAKKLGADLQINERQYKTSLYLRKPSQAAGKAALRLDVQTPCKRFQQVALNVESDVVDISHHGLITLTVNGQAFSLKANATEDAAGLHASLPIIGYESLELAVVREMQEPEMKLIVKAGLPHGKVVNSIITGSISRTSRGVDGLNGRAVIRTTFSKFREVDISLHHEFRDSTLKHRSSISVNGKEYHNASISCSMQQGEISLKHFGPVNVNYKLQFSEAKSAVGDLKVSYKGKVQLLVESRMVSNDHQTIGEKFMKIQTPFRTIVFKRKLKILTKGFNYEMEFTPNQATTSPLRLSLGFIDRSDFTKAASSSDFSLTLPTRTITAKAQHEMKSGSLQFNALLNWDAARSEEKQLKVTLNASHLTKAKCDAKLELRVADKKPYSAKVSWEISDKATAVVSALELDITDRVDDIIKAKLLVVRASENFMKISSSLQQASGNVDFKLNGKLTKDSSRRDGDLEISFMGSDGQVRTAQSSVSFSSTHLSVSLKSSGKSCEFELQKIEKELYTAFILRYQGQLYELRIFNTPSIEFVYVPRKNDVAYISVGYVSRSHLKVDVNRVTDQVKVQHLLAEVQLQTSHLLKTKVHWNPTYALLHYSNLKHRLPSMYESAVRSVLALKMNCVTDLVSQMSRDLVLPDISSAKRFIDGELQLLGKDFAYMGDQFQQMFSRNEFYSCDVLQTISRIASKITGAVDCVMNRLSNAYLQMIHPHVVAAWTNTRDGSVKLMFVARRHCAAGVAHTKRVYHAIKMPVSNAAQAAHESVLRYIDYSVDGLRPALDASYRSYIRTAAAYSHYHQKYISQPIADAVNRGWNRIPDGAVAYRALQSVAPDAYDRAQQLHNTTYHQLNYFAEKTANLITFTKRRIIQQLNFFIRNEHTKLLTSFVTGTYENIKWFLDRFNIEDNLKDFAKDNYLQAVDFMKQNSIGLVIEYLGIGRSTVLENDMRQGKFEARIYSPLQWSDLQSLPTSGLDDVSNRLTHSLTSVRNSLRTVERKARAVHDIIYDSIPDFDMPSGSWIPKFRGVASIQGSNVITFDGLYYRFRPGPCSYVLARDFRTRRWAISMFNSRGKKGVRIHAYDRVLTIESNMRVSVDGVPYELPIAIGNMTVLHMNDKVFVKDRRHLFSVVLDPKLDSLTVSLSGWYHGRLGGMFGNFDNEKFNDMLSSIGARTDSRDEFARSWKLNQCTHTTFAVAAPQKTQQELHECTRLFASGLSPYRRCFGFVDPTPFYAMCQHDRVCNAAAIYIRHCQVQAVKALRKPNHCQRCQLVANGDQHLLLAGQKVSRSIRKQKADVVFVVEERGCLGQRTLGKLPELARSIESSLTASAFNDIRFSLLGFGNPDHKNGQSRPHWHTLRGDISGNADAMAAAISKMSLNKDAGWKSDPLDAVYGAVEFSQFRHDASKHVVLVSCSECHDARRTMRTVLAAVESAGVHLHLLTHKSIPTYYQRRAQAFGYDSSKAFTIEARDGSSRIKEFMKTSSDKCALLATKTGGSVFDLTYFRNPRFNAQSRMFSSSFAERLAKKSSAEVHEECSCGSTSPMQPMRCRRL